MSLLRKRSATLLSLVLLFWISAVSAAAAWAPTPPSCSSITSSLPQQQHVVAFHGPSVTSSSTTRHHHALYSNSIKRNDVDNPVDDKKETQEQPRTGSSSTLFLLDDANTTAALTALQRGVMMLLVPAATTLVVLPDSAFAVSSEIASTASPSVIGSALVAYGHYLSFLVITICVTVQRFSLQPNMSDEQEDRIATADIIYGLSGLLLTWTGYLRVVQYGKGWDFYSHEPIFWLKIALVGVAGALSFFNTIQIFQRSLNKRNNGGKIAVPMSPHLADRMKQICNAELSAYATIPLTATLMSRGVAYNQDIPWQVGAAISLLIFGGASYKYVKESLEWNEVNNEDGDDEDIAVA